MPYVFCNIFLNAVAESGTRRATRASSRSRVPRAERARREGNGIHFTSFLSRGRSASGVTFAENLYLNERLAGFRDETSAQSLWENLESEKVREREREGGQICGTVSVKCKLVRVARRVRAPFSNVL